MYIYGSYRYSERAWIRLYILSCIEISLPPL